MNSLVTEQDTRDLASRIKGTVALSGSQQFKEAVYTWNCWIQHEPDFVVCIADAEDAQVAFAFAAERKIPVAVQSSGHGAVMKIEGGMLISTRHLQKLHIDPNTKMATVGGGVNWGQVVAAGAVHGLAGVSGSSFDVGVVGYCIGGGMSIIGRKFGWGADRIRSIEIVTPDAKLRHLSPDSEPELFWAVCGGGGNFGVVTEIALELVELKSVYGGSIFYDGQDATHIFNHYFAWTKNLPDEMCSSVAMIWMPPTPNVPEPIRGKVVVSLRVCYVGEDDEGKKLLAPMRALQPVLMDEIRDIAWTEAESIYMDPKDPIPFQQRGALFNDISPDVVDILLHCVRPEARIPMMLLDIRHLGGAFRKRSAAGNSVCGRDASYMLNAVALSTPETEAAADFGLDQVIETLGPWSIGNAFVNSHGKPVTEERRSLCWEKDTYRKICAMVNETDPYRLIRYGFAVGREDRAA